MSRVVSRIVTVVVLLVAGSAFAQNVSVTLNTIPSGGTCYFYSTPGGNPDSSTTTVPTTFPASGTTVTGPIETKCNDSGGVAQSDDIISFNESDATVTVNAVPPNGGWANFLQNNTYATSTPPDIFSGTTPLEIQYRINGPQTVVDETYTWDSTVIISAPAKNTTVSGPINIATQIASNVGWENTYIDSTGDNYLASSPPSVFTFDSILVANGNHTILSVAKDSGGNQIGETSVPVNVSNSGTPNVVYVSQSSGNDNNPGTQSLPWKTIGKVVSMESTFSPGEHILFKGGDTWTDAVLVLKNNLNGTAANPIVFAPYPASGRPVINGQGSLTKCISADQSTTGQDQGNVSYITVAGFECKNTTKYGIDFKVELGHPAQTGIVIQNNYIHDTGPSTQTSYFNQLNMEDDTKGHSGGDGYQVIGNTVQNCGGWNCLEVHYDTGGPVVRGNIVGPGCMFHNCIDLKGAVNGQVTGNTVTCPNCNAGRAGFYFENTEIANASVTYENNLAYNIPKGYQVEHGQGCDASPCAINAKFYNNTAYNASAYHFIDSSCSSSTTDHTLDLEKNIFYEPSNMSAGTIDINGTTYCSTTWKYNDDVNMSGVPAGGTNEINTDPVFLNPSGGYLAPTAWQVLNAGEPDSVTAYTFVGGIP